MKKIKKITFALLFGLCTFIGMSVVNAAAFTISQNTSVVCNPEKISKGGTTDCYITGKPQGEGSVHGYVTAMFVTKDLEITGAKMNPALSGSTSFAFRKASTVSGDDTFTEADLPQEIKAVRCLRNEDWKEGKDFQGNSNPAAGENISDYACAVFYSKGASNAFTPASIRQDSEVRQKIITTAHADYGIIGGYTVKLKEDASSTGDCGHVCVKAWGAETLTSYAKMTEATGGKDSSGSSDTPKNNTCTEIHKEGGSQTTNPGHSPETGAFTSYAVLIAGALIAIGAIAIAKKNNKFNRI